MYVEFSIFSSMDSGSVGAYILFGGKWKKKAQNLLYESLGYPTHFIIQVIGKTTKASKQGHKTLLTYPTHLNSTKMPPKRSQKFSLNL